MTRFEAAGFSLIELVMVLVIVGVVAAYAVPKFSSPAAATVSHQADRLLRDARHAQQLATAWRKRLRVVADGTSIYIVACATETTAPCNATLGGPVTDPATGQPFRVTTQNGITVAAATAEFTSLGRATATTNFVLTGGAVIATVTVNATSGFVSASP